MNNREYLINTLKIADTNLQFFETLYDLTGVTNKDLKISLEITPELINMLNFVMEINLQQFMLSLNNIKANSGSRKTFKRL